MSTTTTVSHHIAHIGKVIWGHGVTKGAARREARKYIREFNKFHSPEGTEEDTTLLVATPATEGLCEIVDAYGGAENCGYKWGIRKGVATVTKIEGI